MGPTQLEPNRIWHCYVCPEGLQGQDASSASKAFYIPNRQQKEFPLSQPRLPFELSNDEVSELISQHSRHAIAATIIGPPDDKGSNQDFALSAVIRGPGDRPWVFAAVADGVSLKTFWPERSSRIAALVAFQVVRRLIKKGFDVTDSDLNSLRSELAAGLRKAFRRDQEMLLRQENVEIQPQCFNRQTFLENRHNDTLWYNSTLLFACLGPEQGFLLYAGDGGIHISKKPKPGASAEEKEVLTSKEDLAVESFVSLAVEANEFSAVRVHYLKPGGTIEVCLASDGVDRTLQREDRSYGSLTRGLNNSQAAHERLSDLSMLPGKEIDNYSLAWLCGPPPKSFEWRSLPVLPDSKPSFKDGPKSPELQTPARPDCPSDELEGGDPLSCNKPIDTASPASSRLRRYVALGMTLVIGFIAGLAIGHYIPWPRERREPDASSQKPGEPKKANSLPKPTAHPAPKRSAPLAFLGVSLETMAQGNALTPQVRKGIEEWARILESNPVGEQYSVVVYVSAEHPGNPTECRALRELAKAQSTSIHRYLKEHLSDKASLRLDSKAYAETCIPPQEDGQNPLVESLAALKVKGSTLPPCDCSDEADEHNEGRDR